MMTPEEFVSLVREEAVTSYEEEIRRTLDSADLSEVRDGYGTDVVLLYRSLDDKGKDALLNAFRWAALDSVASVFAILDGVRMTTYRGDYSLTYEGGEQLNGELTDLFLAAEEEGAE